MTKAMNSSLGNTWFSLLYDGIDFDVPGNGGQACSDYLTTSHRIWESLLALTIALFEVVYSWRCINTSGYYTGGFLQQTSTPKVNGCIKKQTQPHLHRMLLQMPLLICLTMVFGIEIGYKLATKSLMFLLNPCHVLTFSQIYLLTVDNTKRSPIARAVFRVHLHVLSGALLAIVLPVTNTRILPFEPESYWLHHILLYATPIYLISCGNNFVPEPLTDVWWPLLSTGLDFFYHFVLLQGIGLVTLVNLNNMLCPALSDPFEGTFYRMWAIGHQHIVLLFHGKLYQIMAFGFLKLISWVASSFNVVQMSCELLWKKVLTQDPHSLKMD